MATDIFFEIHRDLPREGPGDSASTRRALSMMADLPPRPLILDIGCGPGMQTIEIARRTDGRVVAVDTHQPYLQALKRRAVEERLSDSITPVGASMFALGLADESFDAIWSEGAIYIIGFEQGLRAWRRLLKPGGYMAVTEVSWLRADPPEELEAFWKANYPGLQTVQANLAVIAAAGHQNVGHFTLPSSSWWTDYYTPLEARISKLREKYEGDTAAIRQLDLEQVEINLFRKYSDYYGYVFFVMQVA